MARGQRAARTELGRGWARRLRGTAEKGEPESKRKEGRQPVGLQGGKKKLKKKFTHTEKGEDGEKHTKH